MAETKWFDTDKGKELMKKAFEAADLPEVEEGALETGTYTNRQIIEKFDEPLSLLGILMRLPGGSRAEKRSILSFAAEIRNEDRVHQ